MQLVRLLPRVRTGAAHLGGKQHLSTNILRWTSGRSCLLAIATAKTGTLAESVFASERDNRRELSRVQ